MPDIVEKSRFFIEF